ncbi:MAG: amidohydrolase family protein [Pseudomonadota bacterium]
MGQTFAPQGVARPIAAKPVKQLVIDADVHPCVRRLSDLKPFITAENWEILTTFGEGKRTPFGYPKAVPEAHRADAKPADGSMAGSSYEMMREQYLEPLNIEYALLSPLRNTGQAAANPTLSRALCRAMNHWQVEYWTSRDQRLKASIVVPFEQPESAVAEIEHWAEYSDFAQVLLLTRTSHPLGQQRYWPIYRAAAERGFPIAIHVFGSPGHPSTPGGWPSYYLEEMTSHSAACQGMITSMIIEGVFEAFPNLNVINLEGGFGWVPPMAWRMDRLFERFREEVPHLKMKPSDYLRRNMFFATQPVEEPDRRKHLFDTIEWIGVDNLLFSSDYPHWDFDDPALALPKALGEESRGKIMRGNGLNLYRLTV